MKDQEQTALYALEQKWRESVAKNFGRKQFHDGVRQARAHDADELLAVLRSFSVDQPSNGETEDAARLGWLAQEFEKNGSIAANRYGPGIAGCQLFTITSQHVRGYGLRGAIDAAKAKAP